MNKSAKDGNDIAETQKSDAVSCQQTLVSQQTKKQKNQSTSQHAWEEFCEQVQMEPESEDSESQAQRQATMRYAEEQYQTLMALQRELSSAYTTFMNISM